jgi:hypothetical protein
MSKRKRDKPPEIDQDSNVIMIARGKTALNGEKAEEIYQLTVTKQDVSLQELAYACIDQLEQETDIDPMTLSELTFKFRTEGDDHEAGQTPQVPSEKEPAPQLTLDCINS